MSPGERPLDASFPVILAGPSGAGKTTIRNALLGGADGDRFLFSVSVTTRRPRADEAEGRDYLFVERASFERLVEADAMLEHAVVHGDLYGTPRGNLESARDRGAHLLLDIDVQGARQVRAAVPDVATIFVLPPDGERVIERLRGRGSETPEELGRRLDSARAELDAIGQFDFVVVNEDREAAIARTRAIIAAEEAASHRVAERAAELAGRIASELDRVRRMW